jgi:hypothetical protein
MHKRLKPTAPQSSWPYSECVFMSRDISYIFHINTSHNRHSSARTVSLIFPPSIFSSVLFSKRCINSQIEGRSKTTGNVSLGLDSNRTFSSVVGIATGYGLDGPEIESRWGARFSAPVQTGPGAHPASCTMGTGSFPGVKSGWDVTLTPHPLLVPWSRKSRAIPLLPLRAVRPVQTSVPVQGCTLSFLLTTTIQRARKPSFS